MSSSKLGDEDDREDAGRKKSEATKKNEKEMKKKLREKKQLEHRPTDNERRGSWRSFNIERNFG